MIHFSKFQAHMCLFDICNWTFLLCLYLQLGEKSRHFWAWFIWPNWEEYLRMWWRVLWASQDISSSRTPPTVKRNWDDLQRHRCLHCQYLYLVRWILSILSDDSWSPSWNSVSPGSVSWSPFRNVKSRLCQMSLHPSQPLSPAILPILWPPAGVLEK